MAQIIITKIVNRIELIRHIHRIRQCGLKVAQKLVNAISNGTKLPIDIPDEYLNLLKTVCEFTIKSKRYNMEKNQFKPFDKVLVRDADKCVWKAGIYSHYEKESAIPHVCIGGSGSYYAQCIPYDENTAHLLGTCNQYKEPEPKVWQVSSTGYNDMMTSEELENFIKGAVIRNKDITNFQIRYIDQ